MASRRSRLKAVANLPIRRKPLSAQQESETPKIEDDKAGETTDVQDKTSDNNKCLDESNNKLNEDSSVIKEAPPSAVNPVPAPSDAPLPVQAACEVSREVPAVENAPNLNNNSRRVSVVVSPFSRRIKPCVSQAALKERPQKAVNSEKSGNVSEPSCEESNLIKTNGTVSLPETPVNNVSPVVESLDRETVLRDITETSKHNLSEGVCEQTESGSNVVLRDSVQPQNNLNLNGAVDSVSEKTFQVNLKSPVNGSRTSIIVNGLNSDVRSVQENHTQQRSDQSPQSNRNTEHSASQITSPDISTLQFISPSFKRTSSVRQKKPKFNDFARKVADARREFQRKYEKIPPDRSSLRMIDLIFYNPSTNPMESKSKYDKKEVHSHEQELLNEAKVDDPDAVDRSSDLNADDEERNEDLGKMPVPQVKIGSNGEIILDEKSLVIETTDAKRGREDLQNSIPVFEDRSSKTCYYKRKTQKSRDWSDVETKRFYKALNTIGTDFSLMQKYFPLRTRLELKNKFKREEKLNRSLIDKALNNPSEFDITQFEKYLANEKKAQEEETERRLQSKIRVKKPENRIRAKSSLLAKEVFESDEDMNESQRSLLGDQLRMKLHDRSKKTNEVNMLYEKYSSRRGEGGREELQLSSPVVALNGDNGNSESKLFKNLELRNGNRIRDAFDEIQNITHSDGDKTSLNGGTGDSTGCSEAKDGSTVEGMDVVDDFCQAVACLSASLKSNECKNGKTNRISRRVKRAKPNVSASGRKKPSTQAGRRGAKKQKDSPFVSTLDIETYDSKCESDSSSEESNDNSFTSTKTITDQDFMKLLAANAKNMKESKIQFHISEDCSLQKNVEIILDNVPSITLSEI